MQDLAENLAPLKFLQSSFLVPNLHCPTCITHITSLLDDFTPKPIIKNISIINHIITIAHSNTILAASISDALTSAGYEIFAIIADPASSEKVPAQTNSDSYLEDAVRRWDPRQRSQSVDWSTRQKHEVICQVCAAHGKPTKGCGALESVAVSSTIDAVPLYRATLSIDGMTCSSCIGIVTKSLQKVNCVESADVSLVSRSANVQIRSSEPKSVTSELIQAVEDAGYDAQLMGVTHIPAIAAQPDVKDKTEFWEATYTIEAEIGSSHVDNTSAAIQKLSFVEHADIDPATKTGRVVFKGKRNEGLVFNTIAESGCKPTLADLRKLADPKVAESRTISLQIDGMHCPQCPKRISETVRDLRAEIQKTPTMESPILIISYTPKAPELTIRRFIDQISALDRSFIVTVHKPITVEQRSREMLAKEQWSIFLRAVLSIVTAIPTLIIGVVYMSLVAKDNPSYMYLMQSWHGVSRAEWATFIMATPVYFFAADHFHRRMIKEIYALWRPRSSVPIMRRFYRFGSMNMLISLGTSIAYISSLAELIVAASHPSRGDMADSSRQTYFDSVVFTGNYPV